MLRRYQLLREAVPARDERRRGYRFDGWGVERSQPQAHRARRRARELSNGEFNLLQALCSSPQRVLTRDQLLDLSRLHGAEVYDRSIDVQILRLRRKIESDPAQPLYICTERGAGYVFSVPVEVLE